VSGDFPVQLATRLPDWSAGGLLQCSSARLSVCRVVLQIPRARHARLVADKSLASSSDTTRPIRPTSYRDLLATSSRGYYQDAPVKFYPYTVNKDYQMAVYRSGLIINETVLPSPLTTAQSYCGCADVAVSCPISNAAYNRKQKQSEFGISLTQALSQQLSQ